MPCRSDHMNPTPLETQAGRLKVLLDELDGIPLDPKVYRNAFVYNATRDQVDSLTSKLCEKVHKCSQLSSRSLELQMWWRDHQRYDSERLSAEMAAARDERDRKYALSKLTPRERQLLGIQDGLVSG